MPVEAIRVEGLSELVAAFDKFDRGLGREVRSALKDAGEVVRRDAEDRARERITNIGERWPRMRLGIATGDLVYIVPASHRGTNRRRPNLGGLLISRAMEPAADANRAKVEETIVDALNDLSANAGLISHLKALG